jgi:hypothetical protein
MADVPVGADFKAHWHILTIIVRLFAANAPASKSGSPRAAIFLS